MKHQRAECSVIRIGKRIDECVHRVSPHGLVFYTGRIDELGVEFTGQQRIGQLSEKLFQQTGNTIDIVLKSFGITEVDLSSICNMSVL